MKLNIINRSGTRAPNKFLQSWIDNCTKSLKQRRVSISNEFRELTVVLVKNSEMKKLNDQYRKKDYATDVLSFASMEPNSLGELVIAPKVIQKQARDHGLTYEEELGYMVLHGVLHLLGYDHETGARQARKMFQIQDDVFEKLCLKLKHVSSSRSIRTQKKVRGR